MWTYVNVAGSLHCASFAVSWHTHGCSCGPEKRGPPFGWFVTTSFAARLPAFATIVLLPTLRWVTRPSTFPSAAFLNALLRFLWRTVTRSFFVYFTPPIRTSASPPLTRSARGLESTEIVIGDLAAAA